MWESRRAGSREKMRKEGRLEEKVVDTRKGPRRCLLGVHHSKGLELPSEILGSRHPAACRQWGLGVGPKLLCCR